MSHPDPSQPPGLAVSAVQEEKWFRGGLILAGFGLGILLWTIVCTVPGFNWNPARLAPSFALARGLPIYALRDSGLQLGWFYGPVFPLWYLPVSFIDQPTLAHMLAALWNAFTYLAPVALVLRVAGVASGRWLAGYGLLAALLLLAHPIAFRNFYYVHVDVVCLLWGLLACAALHRGVRTGRPAWLHLAAASLALAVWSKQIAFMLYPALLVWMWREAPRPMFGRMVLWCVVHGAAISALFLAWFGAEEILFNVWLFHSRNSWEGGWIMLLQQAGILLASTLPWLPVALAAGWLLRGKSPALPAGAASLVRLLLWAAAWQAPLGLMAPLKTGGGLNSFHSLHYAFVAGMILLACALQQTACATRGRLVAASGLILIGLMLGSAFRSVVSVGAVWTPHRGQEHLLQLAREQPGRMYFPGNPLVTIIAERRIQPLDYALYCLWCARLEVPAEAVRAAVPEKPIILYQEPAQGHFALRYFPRSQEQAAEPVHP